MKTRVKDVLADLRPIVITILAGMVGAAFDALGSLLDSGQPLTWHLIFSAIGTAIVGWLVAWGKEHKAKILREVIRDLLDDTGNQEVPAEGEQA